MKKIDGGITAPKGFLAADTAAGIKYKDRRDMAMIFSEKPCRAAGTFTKNVVKAAPVKWDREIVENGPFVQAVVVNAGIANACTGEEGMSYCKETAEKAGEKRAVYVDVVHGSMLMVSGRAFLECGGYDEGIFLYQEEMVLADRMKALGYRTVLLLTEHYRHDHSVSISKSFHQELERQRIREQSTLYYMRHYLSVNRFQEWAARLWFWGIRMEVRVFRMIFG